MFGVPVFAAFGHSEQKIGQHPGAVAGMHHFGMELDAVEFAPGIRDRGKGARVGTGKEPEAGRDGGHRIAMAHPDLLVSRHKQRVHVHDLQRGHAIFTAIAALHNPTEVESH